MKATNSYNHLKNHTPIHRNQLLTLGDLEDFKIALFDEMKKLFGQANGHQAKPWLRSSEVRKLLGVSAGTLQNLRINGTLLFSKIGGIVYYKQEAIVKLLEDPKSR